MRFCPECGLLMRIYKKRNKTEYYLRCRKCKLSLPIKDKKVVLINSSPRKNARLKRTFLENLPKINHRRALDCSSAFYNQNIFTANNVENRLISLEFIETPKRIEKNVCLTRSRKK